MLYNVEAPTLTRFKRFTEKYPGSKGAASLEEFVKLDDHASFNRSSDHSLKPIHTFQNKEHSIDALYLSLSSNHSLYLISLKNLISRTTIWLDHSGTPTSSDWPRSSQLVRTA